MSVQQDDVRTERLRSAEPAPSGVPAPSDVGAPIAPENICWCAVTTLPTPVGHIVVLRVAGEIDLFTVAIMQTALTAVLVERPEHVIVDLAGVRFCSGRGLAALINTAATCGVGFALSGASSQIERVWGR